MKHPLRASLFAAMLAAGLPAFAAPDAQLLAAARTAEPAVIQSLKEMVLIESGTMDAPSLVRIVDYAESRLKALGMAVQRYPAKTTLGEACPAGATTPRTSTSRSTPSCRAST